MVAVSNALGSRQGLHSCAQRRRNGRRARGRRRQSRRKRGRHHEYHSFHAFSFGIRPACL